MLLFMACAAGAIFVVWHSFCDALAWRIYTAYYSRERKTIGDKLAFILQQHSRCEHCGARVSWVGLIPVLGYFLVHGKCPRCTRKISPRFPVFEALAFVYGAAFAATNPTPAVFLITIVAYALIWIVMTIDYRVMLIPTEAILGLLVLGIVYLLAIKHPLWNEFTNPDLGLDLAVAFVWYFLFHLLRILSGYKMGLADVRLVLGVGFLLGHPLALFLPGIAAFLAIGFYLVRRRSVLIYAPSETHIPFGVFLGLGYLLLNLAGRMAG